MKITFYITLLLTLSTSNSERIIDLLPIRHMADTSIEAKASEFSGIWVNDDEEARGITKCKIRYENGRFIVQMWGACVPEDCDWGEQTSKPINENADNFEVLWDQKFAESTATYKIVDGKLEITNQRRFNDDSGREDFEFTDYLIKQ